MGQVSNTQETESHETVGLVAATGDLGVAAPGQSPDSTQTRSTATDERDIAEPRDTQVALEQTTTSHRDTKPPETDISETGIGNTIENHEAPRPQPPRQGSGRSSMRVEGLADPKEPETSAIAQEDSTVDSVHAAEDLASNPMVETTVAGIDVDAKSSSMPLHDEDRSSEEDVNQASMSKKPVRRRGKESASTEGTSSTS
jgi:hypothetical protein